ncbi:MAG TPA: RNA polymerase sigma factor [Bacteroidia bacterium]|nr:RNA polymerase sigma factor [Bacteroidia bacterium]
MPELLDDNELVRLITESNNADLFSILYDRYSKVIYNKSYSFVKNQPEAEDLSHDIFLKLFIELRKFQGKSKFSTWLYSFTYNFLVNYVNRKKDPVSFENIEETWSAEEESNEPADYSDEELFQSKYETLMKALDQLKPQEKAVLLMKYLDDLSIKEIMEVTELGESAVKMKIKRAKAKVVELVTNIDKNA